MSLIIWVVHTIKHISFIEIGQDTNISVTATLVAGRRLRTERFGKIVKRTMTRPRRTSGPSTQEPVLRLTPKHTSCASTLSICNLDGASACFGHQCVAQGPAKSQTRPAGSFKVSATKDTVVPRCTHAKRAPHVRESIGLLWIA